MSSQGVQEGSEAITHVRAGDADWSAEWERVRGARDAFLERAWHMEYKKARGNAIRYLAKEGFCNPNLSVDFFNYHVHRQLAPDDSADWPVPPAEGKVVASEWKAFLDLDNEERELFLTGAKLDIEMLLKVPSGASNLPSKGQQGKAVSEAATKEGDSVGDASQVKAAPAAPENDVGALTQTIESLELADEDVDVDVKDYVMPLAQRQQIWQKRMKGTPLLTGCDPFEVCVRADIAAKLATPDELDRARLWIDTDILDMAFFDDDRPERDGYETIIVTLVKKVNWNNLHNQAKLLKLTAWLTEFSAECERYEDAENLPAEARGVYDFIRRRFKYDLEASRDAIGSWTAMVECRSAEREGRMDTS